MASLANATGRMRGASERARIVEEPCIDPFPDDSRHPEPEVVPFIMPTFARHHRRFDARHDVALTRCSRRRRMLRRLTPGRDVSRA
ncbi:MAG TPA: hypothetical protein VFO31_15435 [Vicinamibacterales bacterium]|nr:hypothetical protein [Vicinamibacterales bacterium]